MEHTSNPLEGISAYFFDPCLGTRALIEAQVSTMAPGTAHPCCIGDRRVLLLWDGSSFHERDITEIDAMTFINEVLSKLRCHNDHITTNPVRQTSRALKHLS